MKKLTAVILLALIAAGFSIALAEIPFGQDKIDVGNYYIDSGIKDTGATNIVTSIVVNYRSLDTLGEITILFVAALGVGALLFREKSKPRKKHQAPSLIVATGSKILFPLTILFGIYIFLHGHLTPGGGFQGGAVIASGFLLLYLSRPEYTIDRKKLNVAESLGGLTFIVFGLLGLAFGGHFLQDFLPKGHPNALLSAGVIPLLYLAIGVKVGSELARIIGDLMEAD
ncbi:MAG: Na(+)/H(+) antiporter subunit B [Deltaproteobacteria bacterium]|nr:Na(+)/H(+) antiporter subunit B [Deltaproteobacteria bacterium]